VVITSVFDWRTFPDLRHDMQLTGDFGVNRLLCQPTWPTEPFILLSSKLTQAFAMCICVVAPPGEC